MKRYDAYKSYWIEHDRREIEKNESRRLDACRVASELAALHSVCNSIIKTREMIPDNEQEKTIYMESLALKLHNFYNGCERIFEKIAVDINGGIPGSFDWHKRLLHSSGNLNGNHW